MISITVNTQRFNQMLWNALLFTTKTSVTAGKVFFSIRTEAHWDLTMFACDDFIAVQDSVPFTITEQANAVSMEKVQFTLPLAVVKTLETETRKVTEDTIDISIAEGKFLCLDSDQELDVPEQFWAQIISLAEGPYAPTEFALDFYINPDRLKQIPRMKIEGDHPVGFRYAMLEDQTLVPFVYGPTVRGVIISMDERTLFERGVFMWPEGPQNEKDDTEMWEAEGWVHTHNVVPEHKVGDTVTVAGIEFTKVAELVENPPWDIDIVETGKQIASDRSEVLDQLAHVDKDQHAQFGF